MTQRTGIWVWSQWTIEIIPTSWGRNVMLTDLLGWLAGKKTYLLGLGMVFVAGLYAQGYITEIAFKALMALLGGGTAMALRAAISKGAKD